MLTDVSNVFEGQPLEFSTECFIQHHGNARERGNSHRRVDFAHTAYIEHDVHAEGSGTFQGLPRRWSGLAGTAEELVRHWKRRSRMR